MLRQKVKVVKKGKCSEEEGSKENEQKSAEKAVQKGVLTHWTKQEGKTIFKLIKQRCKSQVKKKKL